jgi:hypothetical protein
MAINPGPSPRLLLVGITQCNAGQKWGIAGGIF